MIGLTRNEKRREHGKCNDNSQKPIDQWIEAENYEKGEHENTHVWNQRTDSFPENTERATLGRIGVDLDGTLAKSVIAETREKIGLPIHPMVQLVKIWLAHGEMSAFSLLGSIPIAGKSRLCAPAELCGRKAAGRLDTWLRNELTARFEGRILPVDLEVADACGRLVARSESLGRPMEPRDAFVAATAEVHGLI